jgi:predicted Zn-dependent peptidase
MRKSMVLTGIALEASSDLDAGFACRFTLGANSTDVSSLAKVEGGLKRTVAELIEKGVTQEELDLERADYLAAEIYRLDYQSLLAVKYGGGLMVGLSLENQARWIDEIKAVGVEDVNAVARKYLVEPMRVMAQAWPASADPTSASSPVADGSAPSSAAGGAK